AAHATPAAPPRSLTVFNGFATVPANTTVPIPINGFTTPPSGPVNAQLGFVSYAGDLGKTGDSLQLNGNTLSDPTRPANNFFNSSITNLGTRVTAKNPNFVNQIGFDLGMVDASGDLPNGATSTTLTAVGENTSVAFNGYNPQVFTLAIDQYDPDVATTKSAANLTSIDGNVRPGDVLQYTV